MTRVLAALRYRIDPKIAKFGASDCHFLQLEHQRPYNPISQLLSGVILCNILGLTSPEQLGVRVWEVWITRSSPSWNLWLVI